MNVRNVAFSNHILIAGKTLSVKGVAFVEPSDTRTGVLTTRVVYVGGATVELDAATDYVVAKLGLR